MTLARMGTAKEILEACQRVTLTLPTYSEPPPLTLAEKINVSDLRHTFENFKVVPGVERCLTLCQEMAEGTCATPFGFMYGGVGNGKTYLLEAMVICLNERGLWTQYHTWDELLGNIRRFIRHQDDEPSAEEITLRICKAPRLVIDDLGMGTTDTDWELSRLETIINFRYRAKLFTAIATNKDIKQLPERVISRLADKEVSTVVVNRAPDFRRTKSRPA